MEKCLQCRKDYTYHLTDANTGLRDYYCKQCFYTYLKIRQTANMPEFIKKMITK